MRLKKVVGLAWFFPLLLSGLQRKCSRAVVCITALLVFITQNLSADPAAWSKDVKTVVLKNGMTAILYPHGTAPIFSGYIRVKVGGMDEEEGKTGLAHFLEHMAFKGTEKIGTRDYKKEKPLMDKIEKLALDIVQEEQRSHPDLKKIEALKKELKENQAEQGKYIVKEAVSKIMLEHGGVDYNATTSKDMTSYFVNLPAEQFKFWAEFESDRIFRPVFREFYEEREVVMEERRMRVEDDPDGKLYEAFLQTAFEKSPYRWPTIGTWKDLKGLTRTDLEAFWSRYYQPSNVVLAIVGQIDPEKAIPVLEKTFGKIPSTLTEREASPITEEPPQRQAKRVTLSLQAKPRFIVGYHKPTLPSAEDYIFDIIQQVLLDGRTSRLYKRLVLESQVASAIHGGGGTPGSRLHHLFAIDVDLRDGKTTDQAMSLIREELHKLATQGVTTAELEKTKNTLAMAFINRLRTNEGLAEDLSYYQIVAGDWKYLENYLETISKFRSEDIKKVAAKYFVNSNETIAEIK